MIGQLIAIRPAGKALILLQLKGLLLLISLANANKVIDMADGVLYNGGSLKNYGDNKMSENGTIKQEQKNNTGDVTAPVNTFRYGGGLRFELGVPIVDNRNSPEVLASIDAHSKNSKSITSGIALTLVTGMGSGSSVNHEPTF